MAAYSYHLRRINQIHVRSMYPALDVINLDQDCVKFGRNPEQVNILLHASACANMISREHAEIRRSKMPDGTIVYHLYDRSLNGTYVNDYRVDGHTLLQPGDVIQFGHINGAAIRPGEQAPQPDAEFTYLFEKVPRQQAALDAKMVSLLANSAAAAGGRLSGAPAAHQWPHPYALAGAHPAYLAAAAAGFNPYLSPMPPLIPAQNVARGSPFAAANPYNAPLSSSGTIMHPGRQSGSGEASVSAGGVPIAAGSSSWLQGVANAAHQNASAAVAGAIRQHTTSYHRNQSPIGAVPMPQAMAMSQHQLQGNLASGSPVINRSVAQQVQQQQHHDPSLSSAIIDNRYKDQQQQQSARNMGQPNFAIQSDVQQRYGHLEALAGAQQRLISPAYPYGQSDNECRYASPPAIAGTIRDRNNRFLANQVQLQQQPCVAPPQQQQQPIASPAASTYSGAQMTSGAQTPLNVKGVTSPAPIPVSALRRDDLLSQQQLNPATTTAAMTSPVAAASMTSSPRSAVDFKSPQQSPSYTPVSRISGSETTTVSPSSARYVLQSQQQQRNTVVVEAPVRTQADTSSLTPSTNSTSQRFSCAVTPQSSPSSVAAAGSGHVTATSINDQKSPAPVAAGQTAVTSEASAASLPKMECDSSVPSPPEDPGLRRSTESAPDVDDDNQAINRDIYKLASAAQSRCMKDSADAEDTDDVFEISRSGSSQADSRPKSRSPSSPSSGQHSKRSPSPLRTALHSSKTSDLMTEHTIGRSCTAARVTFGQSADSANQKKPRRTNEVARLLTDLSDSSFMYEMRKKEARIRKRLEKKKNQQHRRNSKGRASKNSSESASDGSSSSSESTASERGSKSEDEAEKQSTNESESSADEDDEPIKKFVEKSKQQNLTQHKFVDKSAKSKKNSENDDDDDVIISSSVSDNDQEDIDDKDDDNDYAKKPLKQDSDSDASKNNNKSSADSNSDSTDSSDYVSKKKHRTRSSIKSTPTAPNRAREQKARPARSISSAQGNRGDRKIGQTRRPVRRLAEPLSGSAKKVDSNNKRRRSSSSSSPNTRPPRRTSTSVGVSARSGAKNRSSRNAKRLKSPASGGRAKNSQQQPAAVSIPIDSDLSWTYHDPTVACASKDKCLKPSDSEVQWVQCDDCNEWYHVPCAGIDFDDVKDEDEEFHCGCT